MGSLEGNKFSDGTGFQPSEPALCSNGCGFFGAAATMGLCSKCYRDFRIKEEKAASAKAALGKLRRRESDKDDGSGVSAVKSAEVSVTGEEEKAAAVVRNRCWSCNRKVGLMGFQCRCGSTFCGIHRYAEEHDCTFDFKAHGRDGIAKANPVIKAYKIDRI